MKVLHNIDEFPDDLNAASVTIGNFDGVHAGHQKLFKRVVDRARGDNGPAVCVTFDPHPLRVLTHKSPPFITMIDQKLELLTSQGLDFTLCLEFSKELAALEPEKFVLDYLLRPLKMAHLVIGYDYAFGKGRKGNFDLLSSMGRKYGFSVDQLEPVIINGAVVSSTRIRDLVEAGNVWDVRPLLSRFYQVRGQVVRGMDRGGKLLGFPTANVHLRDELFPKPGVYAVWSELDGKALPGVANIGFNPTFGNDLLSVEVHIFDFSGNIYDRDIRVHFVQRLRDEKKFNGLDELKEQISRDASLGRKILSASEAQLR